MSKILAREDILAAQDLPVEEVVCPEWGGTVLVRALSAADRLEMARRAMTAEGNMDAVKSIDFMVLIPALCLVDEQGQRLFCEADLEVLGRKNGAPLQRIMDVVQRLSQLDLSDAKKD